MEINLMAHSGDDILVVNAARASFDKEITEFTNQDDKLLDFLAREGHLLPFRHPQVTLRLRDVPLVVLRQLDKHQVGFSTSEVSRRYVTNEPEFFEPDAFRVRPANIKQGSRIPEEGEVPHYWDQDNRRVMREAYHHCRTAYETMLKSGVAPEIARVVLPQAMCTTQVKTGSLLGWSHLVNLRTAPDAQLETQQCARMIEAVMTELYPASWKALKRHGY